MTLMNCNHKPCTGQVEDGYCNVCGMAPPEENSAPAAATTGASAAGLSRVTGKLTGRSTLTSRRATTGSTIASSRKMLGAGLVHIEPLLKSDPAKAVMKEARVPDHKRECSNCGTALTKRENGFCPSCSTQYDFRPKLAVGEMVADQYRVEGCIAFGGMGWIYLAMDVTLNRWVVLRLLNSSDPTLAAAAVAERQFLARGQSRQHRQDLHLRAAQEVRLHRDGIRRWSHDQVHSQGKGSLAGDGSDCLHPPGAGFRLHAQRGAWSIATSSPTT
ncbi:MAG: hypothetical protein IPL73_06695 [Candidatus Obscuribacter sp.]|nr:hypothetical protein [Candidatus Obscuribacter sp.]